MDSDDQTGPFYAPSDQGYGTQDSAARYSSQSWLQRLGGAAIGAVIGLGLIGAMVFGLSWNEGRAVQTARSLDEGAGSVREADPAQIDPALEGKLIHLAGQITTRAKLTDPDFAVEAQVVRLVRHVETYLWRETRHSSTEKRPGGGEDTVNTYSYDRVWSDQPIDSSHFYRAADHTNPRPRFGAFEIVAKDANLGAYHPGRAALQQLPADQALILDAAASDRARAQLHLKHLQLADGRFYLGAEPGTPRIGDMRVGFNVMPNGPVTLVGRQGGSDVYPFQTQAGDKLLLGAAGIVPAADMFRSAQDANTVMTWLLRGVFLLVMACGWRLLFRPLSVIGDIVPVVGTIVEFGLGLLSILLTLLLGPLVIAIAWLSFRPVAGIAVLGIAVVAAVPLRRWSVARRLRWAAPGLAAVLTAMMASGAIAQDRSEAETLRQVEDAGQVTSTAAACGARRRQVDLVVEHAVREAIQRLGQSRTGEAVSAARRGEDKVTARLPVVGSAECSEAMRQCSNLAMRLDAQ